MDKNAHAGLPALLTPESSVVLLIDHQPFQIASINSHEPRMIANNVAGLAEGAKVYDIPTNGGALGTAMDWEAQLMRDAG